MQFYREGFIASWEAPELEAVLWENPMYGILEGILETGQQLWFVVDACVGAFESYFVTAPVFYSTEITIIGKADKLHFLEGSIAISAKGKGIAASPGSEAGARGEKDNAGTEPEPIYCTSKWVPAPL